MRQKVGIALAVILLAAALTVCAVGALVWPEAAGDVVLRNGSLVVDASHASSGYIMASANSDSRLKLRIAFGDTTHTYDLSNDGEWEVFPLQMGSGNYSVSLYVNISGTQYSGGGKVTLSAQLSDEMAPFLCPNQYVWYTEDTQAVAKSRELCAELTTDREKADAVNEWISTHMVYDYIKAATVRNYLPDLDKVFDAKMGICFDFASAMSCMLRVEGIPTMLMIGYADELYHAWCMVYLDGEWVRYDPTAEITNWTVTDYTDERFY